MENKNKYEKVMEFNMLENQLRQIEQQIILIDQQINRQKDTINNLNEFKKIQKGTESFLPLSDDILVKATITDNKNLLVNVGGKTLLSKNAEEIKKIIQKQISKLENLRNELGSEIDLVLQELLRIEQEMKV
jgi:prefoldin alpha subunit